MSWGASQQCICRRPAVLFLPMFCSPVSVWIRCVSRRFEKSPKNLNFNSKTAYHAVSRSPSFASQTKEKDCPGFLPAQTITAARFPIPSDIWPNGTILELREKTKQVYREIRKKNNRTGFEKQTEPDLEKTNLIPTWGWPHSSNWFPGEPWRTTDFFGLSFSPTLTFSRLRLWKKQKTSHIPPSRCPTNFVSAVNLHLSVYAPSCTERVDTVPWLFQVSCTTCSLRMQLTAPLEQNTETEQKKRT